MRERIAYVHSPDTGVDPDALEIDSSGLRAPSIEAVRQGRLTLGLDELPREVAQVLREDLRELHLRWAGSRAYKTLDPFTSRVSPGLHVFYTPVDDSTYDPSRLCSSLQMFGPLDCMSREAFTLTKDQHGPGQPTYYFYQHIESLQKFSESLATDLCRGDETCQARSQDLAQAAALDFSFDSPAAGGPGVSKLTAFWPLQTQSVAAATDASETRRTEVGIFTQGSPPNMGAHHIGMGGLLTVLGERKTPSPTLFGFPSRHRSNGRMIFSSTFLQPTGLHPTLQITLSDNQPPEEDADCRPYAYLTLPKTIFADRYQLDDELFMTSKNLTASRYTTLPVDLEAPAYTTATWGSSVLLEMAAPPSKAQQAWTAEVPLHLRYLEPSSTGERTIEVPYPAVFWACQAHQTVDFTNNPFDRQKLGYDALFDPSTTVFWHVRPSPADGGDRLMNRISVPVLRDEAASWVGLGTAGVIAVGFAWVLWKIGTSLARHGYRDVSSRERSGKDTEGKKTR